MLSHTSTVERQQRHELQKTRGHLLSLVRIVSDFEGSAVLLRAQDAALSPFGVLVDVEYMEENFALMELNERRDRQVAVDGALEAARAAAEMWTALQGMIMQFADATGFATDEEVEELVEEAFQSAVFGVSDPEPGVPELQTELYAGVKKYVDQIAKAKGALPPVANSVRHYFRGWRPRAASMLSHFCLDNDHDDNFNALVDNLALPAIAKLRGLCKGFRDSPDISERWPRLRIRSNCGEQFGFPAFSEGGVLKVSERQASDVWVDVVLPCPGKRSDVDNFSKYWDNLQQDPDHAKHHGPRPKSCLASGLTLHQMTFAKGTVRITAETVHADGRPAPNWFKNDANLRHKGYFAVPTVKAEEAEKMAFYEPPAAKTKVWWRRPDLPSTAARPPPLRLKVEATFKTQRFGGEFSGKLTTLSPIFVVVARHPHLCRRVLEARRREALEVAGDEE